MSNSSLMVPSPARRDSESPEQFRLTMSDTDLVSSTTAVRRKDVALSVGWICSAALFVAAYVFTGFYGWAAIFIWGLVVIPLARLTIRRLTTRHRTLEVHRIALARRGAWLLAVGTLFAGFAPPLLAPYQTPIVTTLTVWLIWIVFAGQLIYVGATTQWMVQSLLRRLPTESV